MPGLSKILNHTYSYCTIYCRNIADGEVIWRSEIEAIMAGKPSEKEQSSEKTKDDAALFTPQGRLP